MERILIILELVVAILTLIIIVYDAIQTQENTDTLNNIEDEVEED